MIILHAYLIFLNFFLITLLPQFSRKLPENKNTVFQLEKVEIYEIYQIQNSNFL